MRKIEVKQLNTHIYPAWWGTEEDNYTLYVSDDVQSKSKSRSKDNYRAGRTEVYFGKEDYCINNARSKSKPKQNDKYQRLNTFGGYSKPKNNKKLAIPKQNKSAEKKKYVKPANYDNFNEIVKKTESKIKHEVENDRNQFQASKMHKQRLSREIPKEWKYSEMAGKSNVNSHDASRINTPDRLRPLARTNYMISYDREFKPEMIKEISKEKNNKSNNATRKESQAVSQKENSKSEKDYQNSDKRTVRNNNKQYQRRASTSKST
jgi:hypothetical protein